MKTLRRYLVKQVFASTMLVLGALLMLWSVFEFMGALSNVSTALSSWRKLLITFANVPANAYLLLPIAALLGSLMALAQLNVNSEYTVMRASGASVWQIIFPLAGLGLVFAIAAFLLAEFAVPAAETLAQTARASSTSSKNTVQRFKSGFWFREGNTFINIGGVLSDRKLSDVRVFEFDSDGRLAKLTLSESASFLGATEWDLTDVKRTRITRDKLTHETAAAERWQSALTPNLLSVLQAQPDRLSASSLWEYTQHLRRNNQKSNRFESALWSKALYPLACCVLIILALPFAQVSQRSGGVGMRIFVGILVGLSFILCNQLFTYLGQIYNWPPSISALLPFAMFMVLTVVMIVRVERR
jgi:lipopolysaccharide export system permease protein